MLLSQIPTTFRLGDIYPLSEGQQIEYKETYTKRMRAKMHETFCAFLNSTGGYFIIGIVDITREIKGVPKSLVDDILLDVDTVIHERTIVNTTTGLLVGVDTISGKSFPIEGSDNVIVVVRVVNSDPSHVYIMSSGMRIFRLNASNCKILTSDKNNVVALQSKISTLLKTNELVVQANNQISTQLKHAITQREEAQIAFEQAIGVLYAKILDEKRQMELMIAKRSYITAFIPCLNCILC